MLEQELAKKTEEIEMGLRPYLFEEAGFQKTVLEAVNYSLTVGGKRLRPIFLTECNRLFFGEGLCDPLVRSFAAAIEMIHTYSLVHDDLPAMDNDQYRRGKLTTHAKYGEAMGILTGDALLTKAFEITSATLAEETKISRILAGAKAMQVLSKKAGADGMLGGQAVDVEKTGSAVDEKELEFIYQLKTGALLEASMMIGGILAGASKQQVFLLERIAACVGMAFQIQDDILDVTSSFSVLGKPVRSDERNTKTTYVTLHTLGQASQKVAEQSEEAVRLLEELPGEKGFLRQLILSLIDRKK